MWNKKTTYYYKHHKKLPLTLLTLSVQSKMRIIMKKINQSIFPSVWNKRQASQDVSVFARVGSIIGLFPQEAQPQQCSCHHRAVVRRPVIVCLSPPHTTLTDLSNSTLPILLNIWELKIAQTTLIVDSSHDCTRWIYTSSLRFFTSTSSCFILIVW